MRKFLMLTLAGLRKNKGHVGTLLLLIMIASLLLNTGLLVKINFDRSFMNKVEELHAPHAVAVAPELIYQDSFEEYFKNYPGVIETQKEDILYLPLAKYDYGGGRMSSAVMFLNADKERSISKLTFVGKQSEISDTSIFVPYLFKTGGGYKLGDDFKLSYQGKEYNFRITGFTEDIFLGAINSGGVGFHLPEASYIKFRKEAGVTDLGAVMLSARLSEPSKSEKLIIDYERNAATSVSVGKITYMQWNRDLNKLKYGRTYTANVISLVIVAFAAIIIFVSLIVIRFRILNNIDEDMVNIGALKAAGYTGWQIILPVTLQFILISFIGSILGITGSYLMIGRVSGMLSSQTGLLWSQGFDLRIGLISLLLILLTVSAVSLNASRRIKALHPIIALRGGLLTHNFRRNYFPMDKTGGNLQLLLSLKYIMQNLKQNIMIILIVAAVSFASVFSVVMFYNIAIENDAFVNMTTGEMGSAGIISRPGSDNTRMLEEIRKLPEVRKAIYYFSSKANVDNETVLVYATDDFTQVDNNMVYDGRYPKHANEVAIGGKMALRLNKTIEDTITISIGEAKADYLITGFIQSASYEGMEIALTFEGFTRIRSDFQKNIIYVYLKDGENTMEFMNKISHNYPDIVYDTTHMEAMKESQTGAYVTIVTIITIAILFITALVVLLILYLLMKTMLLRSRHNLGIQKALGFTTFRLIQQISLCFLPVIVAGVLTGCMLGIFGTNPMLSILFRSAGVMKASFIIAKDWIIPLGIFISIYAYIVSLIIAGSIRKMSVYELITE